MINLANIKESNTLFDSHYRLIQKIGGGGFSEVWLAYDTIAEIEVALKIYTPNGELDEEGKNDFKREFGRLCNINHSNIIHAIGFGIYQDELPYLAMNICKNGSAKKLIGNIDEKELWNFIEQIASGLQYLHKRGIIHQDMKPDNILINSDGQYLIIDFGISTKIRNTLRKSTKGSIGGGTTYYMSIESFNTNVPSVCARDIWAFGASLYELITGDVPFGQYGGVTQKAKNGKIPEITQNISKELKQLIYDCLSLNAWDRPDADEIIRRVVMHKNGISTQKNKTTKKLSYLTLSIAAIICCVCGSYVLYSHDPQPISTEITFNRNDSILLAQINEANKIISAETSKEDKSDINENNLCEAAKIYLDALKLDVSDSIMSKGKNMWKPSQKLIDDTYSFFINKGNEYNKIGAESAAQKFEKRSSILKNYISRKSNITDNYSTLSATDSYPSNE